MHQDSVEELMILEKEFKMYVKEVIPIQDECN